MAFKKGNPTRFNDYLHLNAVLGLGRPNRKGRATEKGERSEFRIIIFRSDNILNRKSKRLSTSGSALNLVPHFEDKTFVEGLRS